MSPTPGASKARVLVVEDERDIGALIKHSLERSGEMIVENVESGDAALKAVIDRPPDLMILDLSLPVLDGLEVYRIVRFRSDTSDIPIIMLTARATEGDRVHGLDLGADDYIPKPFGLRELEARVRAVMRRGGRQPSGRPSASASGRVYHGKRLHADFDAVAISVDGAPIRLTRREFELLRYLVENRNRVVSRERLLERVWRYDQAVETRSVDVHIGRLRAKLGPAGSQIETLVGLGYRFAESV
jgi:DNA-binding response OmpR family regulator